MGTAAQIVDQLVEGLSQGALEEVAKLFAEDAILVDLDAVAEGRDAITQRWRELREAFPDGTVTVNLLVENGDCVTTEWFFNGTNTGPIAMPDGTSIPATGKRLAFSGMDVTEIRDGLITSHRIYYDALGVYTQLGLIPTAS